MTQVEAVSKALLALGPEAQPNAIRAWIKRECSLSLKNSAVSNIKWTLKQQSNGHSGVTASDLATLKALVGRVGADELGRVIQVLQ